MRIIRYAAEGRIRFGVLETNGDIQPLCGSPFETLETAGEKTHVSNVRLLSPVAPRNIYGAGLNYVNHARELGLPLPTVPMLFMKPTSSVVGPDAPIVYPSEAKVVHFEAEVVAVIGRTARRVAVDQAQSFILGYTCGNDVSERVIQKDEMNQGCLLIAKAFDTFGPLGPCIETRLDPADIRIVGRVNGVERQNSSTSDLVFSIPHLVSRLSQAITLHPGDIIMSGTPAGVGPIVPGDVVEVEIPGVGVLRNPVVAEAAV